MILLMKVGVFQGGPACGATKKLNNINGLVLSRVTV